MVADHTLYDTTEPTAGSVALAHQQIIRVKRGGVFENITGDVNNLLDTPSPVVVQREVYGTKGTQSSDNIAYNHVITFDVEAVRDSVGAIAQPWLVPLLVAAKSKGAANKVEAQVFDALDENIPAFEGNFAVAVVPLNTGYADKGGYRFTFTSDGVVRDIVSPIAGTGEPVIESASPATGAAVGDVLVLAGYKFTGTTGITMDAVPVDEFNQYDDNTIAFVVPATVSGPAPIVVTNATGASAAFDYTAAV